MKPYIHVYIPSTEINAHTEHLVCCSGFLREGNSLKLQVRKWTAVEASITMTDGIVCPIMYDLLLVLRIVWGKGFSL